jgi:hypothetical protein
MSIPYRDEQILRILADHPNGLTTGQILAIAKAQRGNELPNSNITSQRIYALRETKLPKIESRDTADGRIHKITAAGRKLLDELGPNDFVTSNIAPTLTPHSADIEKAPDDSETLAPSPLTQAMQEVFSTPAEKVEMPIIPDIDPLAEFDKAVAIMRDAMLSVLIEQTYPEPWPKIADKQEKIELLEKLENMTLLKPELRELLGEIRQDIDQFDPE